MLIIIFILIVILLLHSCYVSKFDKATLRIQNYLKNVIDVIIYRQCVIILLYAIKMAFLIFRIFKLFLRNYSLDNYFSAIIFLSVTCL